MSDTKVATPCAAYSKPEELTNVISHALSAALSFVGLVFLLLKAQKSDVPTLGMFAFALFGIVFTTVFVSGAVAHALPRESRSRRAALALDGAAPAVLVFGFFAVVFLYVLPSGTADDRIWGYTLFSTDAALTLAAAVMCAAARDRLKTVRLFLYVASAFLCVVRLERIVAICGYGFFWFLFGGTGLYAAGLIVGALRAVPVRELLGRLLVIGGAAVHFIGIYTLLT